MPSCSMWLRILFSRRSISLDENSCLHWGKQHKQQLSWRIKCRLVTYRYTYSRVVSFITKFPWQIIRRSWVDCNISLSLLKINVLNEGHKYIVNVRVWSLVYNLNARLIFSVFVISTRFQELRRIGNWDDPWDEASDEVAIWLQVTPVSKLCCYDLLWQRYWTFSVLNLYR